MKRWTQRGTEVNKIIDRKNRLKWGFPIQKTYFYLDIFQTERKLMNIYLLI